jgi:hypothetical protein
VQFNRVVNPCNIVIVIRLCQGIFNVGLGAKPLTRRKGGFTSQLFFIALLGRQHLDGFVKSKNFLFANVLSFSKH